MTCAHDLTLSARRSTVVIDLRHGPNMDARLMLPGPHTDNWITGERSGAVRGVARRNPLRVGQRFVNVILSRSDEHEWNATICSGGTCSQLVMARADFN